MRLTGPNEVLEARLEIRLSVEEAAQLVDVQPAEWLGWESPVWSEQYEQISYAGWKAFLIKTHELRPEGSKYRVREVVLEQEAARQSLE